MPNRQTIMISDLIRSYFQKVRGYSQLCSHLSNACKSYFIFRKGWFHSLHNANMKKISAEVPKITELGYTWDNLSVRRQFWESTSSKFCKETSTLHQHFIKTYNPHMRLHMWLILLRKHACNGISSVSVSVTKSRQVKISAWNMNKIYSLSLEKGVVRILADFLKQRLNKIIIKIMIHGRNALHDHIKWSV